MARVTYGESITEYAGSIGGVTFLRNASGPIAKLRSNPPVNPSPNQSKYQTNMAKLVSFWPTLSQAQKDSWNAIAAVHDHTTPLGEIKTLSGYQWFISCNLSILLIGYSILATAPGWVAVPVPSSFVLQTSATYIRGYWSTPIPDTYGKLLYCTLPLRQSSIKLRRSLFSLAYKASGTAVEYWDFTTKFEALAGVTWADFYASSNCSIIARVKQIFASRGWVSAYTSAIIKIN